MEKLNKPGLSFEVTNATKTIPMVLSLVMSTGLDKPSKNFTRILNKRLRENGAQFKNLIRIKPDNELALRTGEIDRKSVV